MKMKKIANILTTNNKLELGGAYNICRCMDCLDDTLPTLIIGYDNAQEYIKDFNILKKDYPEQNLYWTFKKTERRDEHNEDLKKFCNKVLKEQAEKAKYEYIDILNMGYRRISNLIKYIDGTDHKRVLFIKGFVFIYSERYSVVWGLSLKLCEFLGIRKMKIIDRIKRNRNNYIIDLKEVPADIKKNVGNNLHWLLPLYDYYAE